MIKTCAVKRNMTTNNLQRADLNKFDRLLNALSQVNPLKEASYQWSVLDHELNRYFSELAQLNSTRELHRSSLYRELEEEILAVLNGIQTGVFAPPVREYSPTIRATAWNIERGIQLEGIVDAFRKDRVLRRSDILFLTEVDYGMARSRNLNVAREIAERLELNFAFAPSYINLSKGSGLENRVAGKKRQALHGNALLSRYPLRNVRSVVLPNGKDKMRGKEKRLGSQRAVVAVVEHPSGPLQAVCVHLDAHSTQKHRMRQMRLILDELDAFDEQMPALIGGDWNTSTYNSRNAFFSIVGYARRVLMGINNILHNHYPHPDRWFERHLFRELERRGFNYRDLNEPGACTLHYDVNDLAANGRMADWIPNWCFWFINWALERNGGRCSMKLDWFAGRGVFPSPDFPPRVVTGLHPEIPLSDHDPIVLDFTLAGRPR